MSARSTARFAVECRQSLRYWAPAPDTCSAARIITAGLSCRSAEWPTSVGVCTNRRPSSHALCEERELARFRLHLVKHKSALKNRIHSTLINFGKPCPVSDLFGAEGRRLLKALQVPEPWRGNITASIELIDEIERQIAEINRRLKEGHPERPYVPLLLTVPGIGWVLAFTIAAEIGEIERFSTPEKLTGYTGLCPRVSQSGEKDRRGPLSKHGPTYLRWALLEATMHALKHPAYSERHQRNKKRMGKQRGAKVAQVDLARRLAHAIWHMLSRKEKFAPRGAAFRLAA